MKIHIKNTDPSLGRCRNGNKYSCHFQTLVHYTFHATGEAEKYTVSSIIHTPLYTVMSKVVALWTVLRFHINNLISKSHSHMLLMCSENWRNTWSSQLWMQYLRNNFKLLSHDMSLHWDGLLTEQPVFVSLQGQENFLLSTVSRSPLGPTQPITKGLSPEGKTAREWGWPLISI